MVVAGGMKDELSEALGHLVGNSCGLLAQWFSSDRCKEETGSPSLLFCQFATMRKCRV